MRRRLIARVRPVRPAATRPRTRRDPPPHPLLASTAFFGKRVPCFVPVLVGSAAPTPSSIPRLARLASCSPRSVPAGRPRRRPRRGAEQVKDIIARMKADRAVERIKAQMAHDTAKVTDAVRGADPGADAKSWLSS